MDASRTVIFVRANRALFATQSLRNPHPSLCNPMSHSTGNLKMVLRSEHGYKPDVRPRAE